MEKETQPERLNWENQQRSSIVNTCMNNFCWKDIRYWMVFLALWYAS